MIRKPKQANFDESWLKISKVTTAVMTQESVDRDEWVEQITSVYYLCMAMPTPLADRLYERLKEYLITHVRKCREKVMDTENDIVPIYLELYQVYSHGAKYLNDLYLHLNYHFSKRTIKSEWLDHFQQPPDKCKKYEKVQDLAMMIWKEEMIEKVHQSLVKAILQDINRDRRGIAQYSNKLRDVIHSFVEVQAHEEASGNVLQFYKEHFEEPLLLDTGYFYSKEAQRLYELHDVSTYMVKVIERLDEEEVRLGKFIHSTSINACKKECVNKLIADHQENLLSEYKLMLKNDHVEDLSRLYILIKRLNHGLKRMSEIFHDHVYENGKSTIDLMNSGCSAQEYVDSLLAVLKRFTSIIQVHLSNDQCFNNALNRAMERLVNSTTDSKKYPRSSELLVRHSDHILKKAGKNIGVSEIEEQLHNFIDLFKYVEDKDLFQRFYSKKLAHRLINNLSVSIETEELAINGLKDRCGYEYTSPLQRMIIDMKVSDDLTKEFEQHLVEQNQKLNTAFSVSVLQLGAWPYTVGNQQEGENEKQPEFKVPSELSFCVNKFTEFYSKKYSGRKLRFVFSLSNGTVQLNFTPRQYTITMSAHQTAIALLFNDSVTLKYKQIIAHLGLNKRELDKALSALVDCKILTKSSDDYTVNMEYSSRKSKFKLPQSAQREHSEKEVEISQHAVDEDRRLYIQASIVRSMKSRKVLSHNDLIEQVINQSKDRFTPSISMIKKCIEVLIDKQYIERDELKKDQYKYLA